MAKASFRLPNGTNVTIEGTPEEIKGLLTYYGGQQSQGEISDNKTVSLSKKRNLLIHFHSKLNTNPTLPRLSI